MNNIACFLAPRLVMETERSRDPSLIGVPAAVIDENGIMTHVSEEAAVFGIGVGQKSRSGKSLCPSLRLLSYDFPAYEAAARPLWDMLADESSVVEPIDPQNCFVVLETRDIS